MSETPLNQDQNSDEIDLKDLILPLWKARKQILLTSIIFAVLGGIIGFMTPATYTASSTFLPQTAQSGGATGSLGGLAALAGINLNTPITGGDIPPSMYATVLKSEPFRKQILDAKIWVNGDSVSYRNYLESQPASVLGTIQEYTIGLPWKVIGLFTISEGNEQIVDENPGLQPLSNAEYGLLNSISGKVNITNNIKEGVVTISVVESDPIIAAQITKVTENVLQNWISDHKRKNSKAQFDFISKQFETKQKDFFSIQDQLASYLDQNQNVLSATYLKRLERIQTEFDLVNSVYSELAKQRENAAIQLSKDTPTFSIIDPVKIPKEKTGPRRSFYLMGGFFLGLILSMVWFLTNKPIREFLKRIKQLSS